MTAPILVTGGTGTLGRLVVPRLVARGATVRVLTRRPREARDGVEYVTGDLLQGDLAVDAETVLHLAGDAKHDEQTTNTVVRAARQSGVRHLVYISVVAADRVPLGYFRAKYAAERIVAEGGVPFTTLRAAQFHDFVLNAAQALAKSPVVPVPGMRLQPVEAAEVADRLVELALGEPAGMVPDLAGPEVHAMRDLLRTYLSASGKHRLTMPVRLPGQAGRAYRKGENLNLGADRGTRTWAEYLAEKFPAAHR
jgi:uncharacterized protein YbjT (DUF2867 family)